ncbi:MAG: sugar phosphate isomerase/epimerase [Planctomycetaceae bacterium]|jgi:sugar phosphate isomerase/epimerase|nr:sugar phosphate isomerase/epimerase [Planctomycetaceae bacterium]
MNRILFYITLLPLFFAHTISAAENETMLNEALPIGVIARFDDHGTGLPFDKAMELGVSVIQLKVPVAANRTEENVKKIRNTLEKHNVRLVCVVSGFAGESYKTIPIVKETVGLAPEKTRKTRFEEFKEVSDFAKRLGTASVQFHLGVVPHDTASKEYKDVVQITRDACDYVFENGQSLNLETGQETGSALLQFIRDVNRLNLHVNFDPANMILYGCGEPIEALRLVGHFVRSTHCKDARWAKQPGKEWGEEVLFGTGDVNAPLFLKTLHDFGYDGPLIIERENRESPEQQYNDILKTIEYLKQLRKNILQPKN